MFIICFHNIWITKDSMVPNSCLLNPEVYLLSSKWLPFTYNMNIKKVTQQNFILMTGEVYKVHCSCSFIKWTKTRTRRATLLGYLQLILSRDFIDFSSTLPVFLKTHYSSQLHKKIRTLSSGQMKSMEPIRRQFSVEGKTVYTFSKISNNKKRPKENKIHKN